MLSISLKCQNMALSQLTMQENGCFCAVSVRSATCHTHVQYWICLASSKQHAMRCALNVTLGCAGLCCAVLGSPVLCCTGLSSAVLNVVSHDNHCIRTSQDTALGNVTHSNTKAACALVTCGVSPTGSSRPSRRWDKEAATDRSHPCHVSLCVGEVSSCTRYPILTESNVEAVSRLTSTI